MIDLIIDWIKLHRTMPAYRSKKNVMIKKRIIYKYKSQRRHTLRLTRSIINSNSLLPLETYLSHFGDKYDLVQIELLRSPS